MRFVDDEFEEKDPRMERWALFALLLFVVAEVLGVCGFVKGWW